MHEVEVALLIWCELSSLKLDIDILLDTTELKEHIIYLENLDGHIRETSTGNKSHNKHVKSQHDKTIHPPILFKGYMVLVYNKKHDDLGPSKFKSMWLLPYIVK